MRYVFVKWTEAWHGGYSFFHNAPKWTPKTTILSLQVKAFQYTHPHWIICSLKWIKTATQTDTAVTDSHLHLENLNLNVFMSRQSSTGLFTSLTRAISPCSRFIDQLTQLEVATETSNQLGTIDALREHWRTRDLQCHSCMQQQTDNGQLFRCRSGKIYTSSSGAILIEMRERSHEIELITTVKR